jgi:hypothetical protein
MTTAPKLPAHLLEALAKYEQRKAEQAVKFSSTVRDVTPAGYGPTK